MTVPIETTGLGVRFRRDRRGGRELWGLRDCDLTVPAGSVTALVGANGAGKSTLLAVLAGLTRPTEGTVTTVPRERLALVAQERPLHPRLTVADTLRCAADLNPGRWDRRRAEELVEAGELDPGARIRSLSGGQRTQVALALALGKRPELLLLDEPMADLDPFARRRLMGVLLADVAERGTTVLISSHVLPELENSCDHLIALAAGRVRLDGWIDELLDEHRIVRAAHDAVLDPHVVVDSRTTGRQLTALVRTTGPVDPSRRPVRPTLEELVMGHLRHAPTTDRRSDPEAAA
ncbi:ABC transporter ATP-binding protein (plasmid) [Streptomyces sp. BI20]|uniref:ABC transporter ATP-binding protein n=1 Tax=Streptomyces sp. BI20 TaxID=3403460 RepID=UPI003C73FA99